MTVRSLTVLALLLALPGCAAIKPWQREILARDDMQLISNTSLASLDDHIYFSKEAASGGRGFGGGGCGCN